MSHSFIDYPSSGPDQGVVKEITPSNDLGETAEAINGSLKRLYDKTQASIPQSQVTGLTTALEDKVKAWARRSVGVTNRFATMSSPPTITMGNTNQSTVNPSAGTNGQVSIAVTNAIITATGASAFTSQLLGGTFPYLRAESITSTTGTKSFSGPLRFRFCTDAPAIDLLFLDGQGTSFSLVIDGQWVARRKLGAFTNTGNFRYHKIDFGADVVTYSRADTGFVVTSAGSGYAVGDYVTLGVSSTGGETASTAVVVRVAQVSGGGVQLVQVHNPGVATALPSGTYSQASTTGSGTGLQLTAQFFTIEHSTRRMRQIELVVEGPATFYGVVVDANSSILPYYANPLVPRTFVVGDSITAGTYTAYAGGGWISSAAQKLDLWDSLIVSAQGGTGWNVANGTAPAWSHANRVADMIAANADIYIFAGGQNDTANASLQSAVTTVLTNLQAARPNAYIVGIGNIMGASTSHASLISAGFAAAPNQDRVRFINNQSPVSWFPTTPTTVLLP